MWYMTTKENTMDRNSQTLEEFNADVAERVRTLWQTLNDAGFDVTPEEAKFLWVAGQAALGESVGVDTSALTPTLRRLAEDCR